VTHDVLEVPAVSPHRRLPIQAVPIDRSSTGAAALASEAGVEASFDWGGLAQQLLPIAATTLGSLI
jgi:hypothetical protein